MKVKAVILTLLISILAGCAVFEGDKVPKTTLPTFEVDESVKPTLSYSSIAMGGFGSTSKLPEDTQSIIAGELLSVLEESQYFSRIAKSDTTSDISIEVTLTNTGDPASVVPAFITGLSLYTIPSWATDNFEVVAIVERKDGLKKEYVLTDSTKLVQWLPMIFLFPMNNFSVLPEVRKNMYRKVLVDMQNDGFFNTQETIK